jgi:ABC-type maltose transport system permease subunit
MTVKLFGFKLTDTSALLLFIFALGLIFAGFLGFYSVFQLYNSTDQIAPLYLLYAMGMTAFGSYILYKTIKHRD